MSQMLIYLQENFYFSCLKTLPCGHHCGGVRDEAICLPCLKGCSPPSVVRQDAEDMCMICFTESLGAAPAIQLACRHVYHFTCIRRNLEKRWPGARITFSFANCPICKVNSFYLFMNVFVLLKIKIIDVAAITKKRVMGFGIGSGI
jgi:hypothetical protein